MIFKKRPLFNMKTSLENVPSEWLRHIEPNVMRGAFLPCWVWMGSVDRNGYPIMYLDRGKVQMVHRYVAAMFWDFDKALTVRRTCNVRNCINPSHLQVTARHHKQGY